MSQDISSINDKKDAVYITRIVTEFMSEYWGISYNEAKVCLYSQILSIRLFHAYHKWARENGGKSVNFMQLLNSDGDYDDDICFDSYVKTAYGMSRIYEFLDTNDSIDW